ncbi:hypothetical protein HDV57DRAFT_486580 [Trichoderma longibrachiatum]|uniref:Uncharacterized protein n=1 Tax=Trichoderma longibrachiatum ATCC 18648 TaxID=983965 RepID=A0A2T4BW56_TRILO|nr:hypothetical protein M440DRAFT_1404548 [Trichoderma longibrachiatum ATCC 18648]
MPEPLHLFDLPIDILSLILSNLLTAPNNTPIPLCPCTTKTTINPLPIFLTHPSLYAIAHPLFYGPSNTFLLDLTGNHASHVRHFIDDNAADDLHDDNNNTSSITLNREHPLLPLHRHTEAAPGSRFLLLSQESRRKVRKLEMRIDRLRGWLWDDLGPFLQDMAVRGSLADMTLLVDESCKKSSSSSKDSRAQSSSRAFLRDKRRVFERPPLEGLVRLLADPGIRQARLRVRGRHQRAWCEFHAGRECGSLSLFRQRRVSGGEGNGEGGALTKEEDEEVVDVDWRAILSRIDPEGRRRAVAWQV